MTFNIFWERRLLLVGLRFGFLLFCMNIWTAYPVYLSKYNASIVYQILSLFLAFSIFSSPYIYGATYHNDRAVCLSNTQNHPYRISTIQNLHSGSECISKHSWSGLLQSSSTPSGPNLLECLRRYRPGPGATTLS